MSEPVIIAELAKNGSETVRVQLTEYSGHRLVDARVFTEYRATGEVGPTKRGLSMKVEQLDDLISALKKARDRAHALGWLDGGADD